MAETFSLQVSRWCEKAKGNADKTLRDVVIAVGSRVVTRTPVDTGKAKGNWTPGVDVEPDAPEREIFDKSGAATIANLVKVARTLKAGQVFYFVNGVIYIRPLEYGHSQQAAQGMVRITVAEYRAIVDAAVAKLSVAG